MLALDAALSEHLVAPDDVRAFDAHERPLFARPAWPSRRKTVPRRDREASSRSTGAASCSAWSRTTARSRRALGLMDFSDQIALARAAGRRAPGGRRGSSGSKFTVVLLDEYQDTSVAQALMLSRLFSGPTGTGAATR